MREGHRRSRNVEAAVVEVVAEEVAVEEPTGAEHWLMRLLRLMRRLPLLRLLRLMRRLPLLRLMRRMPLLMR